MRDEKMKLPRRNEEKVAFYFNYLEHLKTVCTVYDIPFAKSDRILYQLDKSVNRDVPIRY